MSDPEVDAIRRIQEVLEELEQEAAQRVAGWTYEKFGGPAVRRVRAAVGTLVSSDAGGDFEDIADLFYGLSPKTEADKALAVGYWLQAHEGSPVFQGFRVNSELKNLGHGLSNVTRALDELMNRKPALVIQTHKSGTSKQARKNYKLTREGLRHVEARIRGESGDE